MKKVSTSSCEYQLEMKSDDLKSVSTYGSKPRWISLLSRSRHYNQSCLCSMTVRLTLIWEWWPSLVITALRLSKKGGVWLMDCIVLLSTCIYLRDSRIYCLRRRRVLLSGLQMRIRQAFWGRTSWRSAYSWSWKTVKKLIILNGL